MAQKIACIGVGNPGRAWAAIFARAGHKVALYDSQPGALDAALPAIEDTLESLASEGLVAAKEDAMRRIRICDSLADALQGVDYVQESVIEDAEAKRAVFRELDRAAPSGAIIASSVSSIPPSEFMANLSGGARSRRRPSGQPTASHSRGGSNARAGDQRGNVQRLLRAPPRYWPSAGAAE